LQGFAPPILRRFPYTNPGKPEPKRINMIFSEAGKIYDLIGSVSKKYSKTFHISFKALYW